MTGPPARSAEAQIRSGVMRTIALASLALSLAALGPILPACANLGVPTACLEVCEERDGEPCQKCIAEEDQKRAEARQKRAEERRRSQPSPTYPGGGSGY